MLLRGLILPFQDHVCIIWAWWVGLVLGQALGFLVSGHLEAHKFYSSSHQRSLRSRERESPRCFLTPRRLTGGSTYTWAPWLQDMGSAVYLSFSLVFCPRLRAECRLCLFILPVSSIIPLRAECASVIFFSRWLRVLSKFLEPSYLYNKKASLVWLRGRGGHRRGPEDCTGTRSEKRKRLNISENDEFVRFDPNALPSALYSVRRRKVVIVEGHDSSGATQPFHPLTRSRYTTLAR